MPMKILLCALVAGAVVMVQGRSVDMAEGPGEFPGSFVPDVHMRLTLREADVTTSEDVELNYVGNYVRIETPGEHDGIIHSVLIHDYNTDVTLHKIAGECIVLTDSAGLPRTLMDWRRVQELQTHDALDVGASADHPVYSFRRLGFKVDRASLSRVMQLECADVNTVSVAAPDDNNDEPESDPENAVIGEVYQPPVPETNDEEPMEGGRQKRSKLKIKTDKDGNIKKIKYKA